jgi:crotonobetainyl-CoA:carnitine CoA-transferase CaiB-like acyl-CoA transferase
LRIDGAPPPDPWDPIAGLYRTADGWVRLHTNFPHHRDGILALLGCDNSRDAVAVALAQCRAVDFESEATAAGLCVAALRSFAQWDAHPHAAVLRARPPLVVERIGPAAPAPFAGNPSRPLSGVRVLDLTRVIAGPVGARALAAHGAEVLHLTGPHLPNIAALVADTGRGKRTGQLDLRNVSGQRNLRALVAGADVFLQSYRPGALAQRGFGVAALAALRPGIVVATLSAYGETGPWAGKRGFDSLVQTATGFNAAEAEAAGEAAPRVLPAQAVDHASGYLLALGVMAALHRRATEGGSWRVGVTLAGTAQWLRGLGRLPDGFAAPDPKQADIADLLEEMPSEFGRITAVRHVAILSATPVPAGLAPMRLDAGSPSWS